MKIYTIKEILDKLENCIEYNIPFSHIRFGDGGIKFIHSILCDDIPQLKQIIRKEGIPKEKLKEVYGLWSYYARNADFIDTPEVYFTDEFWDRTRAPGKSITPKTEHRLRLWKGLYDRAKFFNENYCNPESNYLMIAQIRGNKTLLDVLKWKKVAVITTRPNIKSALFNNDIDADIYKIVKHYQNHYKNSFRLIIDIIEKFATDYDCWLVAAGELGRIYTGTIKEKGGRAVDIGFVADFWDGDDIHPRLQSYLMRSKRNPLELELTFVGKKYEEFI